ncbi:Nn.00g037590.m01.CDS01 [Neocucurbitaria sp. VM-36]
MANEQDYINGHSVLEAGNRRNVSNTSLPAMTAEEDAVADVDEPPEPARTPRPAPLKLHHSSTTSFIKSTPILDRKESLLTTALKSNSNASSPVDEKSDHSPLRGMSCVSTWSNNSGTTAELTSDGGLTSPGTRTSTPSPPLPSAIFHRMMPTFNKKPLELPISIVSHDDENIDPLQKAPTSTNEEQKVEAVLGRKRCIMFACGKKEENKPTNAPAKPTPPPTEEPPKRACTIKFACPTKISTDTNSKTTKTRSRLISPAPSARRIPSSPKLASKAHRDSDSTVCNNSPVSVRKVAMVDRTRRLSVNSDLARCEKYRFHEFASSEEEVEEWTQEVTCHRNRLTVEDTLKVENNLRQLGEEVEEEEALEEEDEEEDAADDDLLDEDDNGSDAYSDVTDEGFQTDDEDGFAVSDDESDAGSDYNWWAPGASTAATSVEHLEQLRLKPHRTVSESSIGSLESREGLKISDKPSLRRPKSRPVNIRITSPELPDSTDFVCGTLDEDRPAEEAYMSTLKRRRAAKQKKTPQDIDPTFPASDPELPDDEEDEVSEDENVASESDFMMHGRMDPVDGDLRGRRLGGQKKRSPAQSPKRLRSPPPAKRTVHRSPPPRKLFGNSPKRLHSPPPPMRLRSPPPTRRGSVNPLAARQRSEMSIRFGGIGERPALMVSASVPRTPIAMMNPFDLEEEEVDPDEMPVRRAIDIQVGLEKKRQRRKEQLYRKQHRKGVKEKRPAPGKGAERMREMGLAAHAHKGKTTAFGPFQIPANTDQKDMHVLSV